MFQVLPACLVRCALIIYLELELLFLLLKNNYLATGSCAQDVLKLYYLVLSNIGVLPRCPFIIII